MYICIYTSMYIYVCMYIYVYMYICTYTYTSIYMYRWVGVLTLWFVAISFATGSS